MKPATLLIFAHVAVLLAVVAAPRIVRGQSVEERLSKIEDRLQQIEKMLKIQPSQTAPTGKSITIAADPYAWVANPNTGKIIRTDSRNGDVTTVHTGKVGKWEVLRAEPYFWLLSAGGAIVRLDKRNGDNTTVYTGKPGTWEFVGKTDGPYVVVTNADTGAVLRFDKRNGDSTVIDQGK